MRELIAVWCCREQNKYITHLQAQERFKPKKSRKNVVAVIFCLAHVLEHFEDQKRGYALFDAHAKPCKDKK